jgi:hypothetical protein
VLLTVAVVGAVFLARREPSPRGEPIAREREEP